MILRCFWTILSSILLSSQICAEPVVLDLHGAPRTSSNGLARRDTPYTIVEEIDNAVLFYKLNVTIGTPGTILTLDISLGTGDTWVNTPSSAYCKGSSNPCGPYGKFDPLSSNTFQNLTNQNFSISYEDTTYAKGYWGKDKFQINGIDISNVQFAIATDTNIATGLLGLGYMQSEISANSYTNLPKLMVDQGKIQCNAISIWLNSANATKGQIIFGGVDTDKYIGDLSTMSVANPTDSNLWLAVNLDILQISTSSGNSNLSYSPFIARIDPGATFIYLPPNMTVAIYQKLNLKYDPSVNYAPIPCSMANDTTSTVDFVFGGVQISLGMNQLIWHYNSTFCIFQISPANGTTTLPTLGVTFMQAAYVVFDLQHNLISLAPANLNGTTTNVVEIPPNGAQGIKGIASSTTATTTTPTSSPTNTGSSQTGEPQSSGLSTGAKAGIGVGVSLGVIAIFSVIALYWGYRKRAQKSRQAYTQGNMSQNRNSGMSQYGQYSSEGNNTSRITSGDQGFYHYSSPERRPVPIRQELEAN